MLSYHTKTTNYCKQINKYGKKNIISSQKSNLIKIDTWTYTLKICILLKIFC